MVGGRHRALALGGLAGAAAGEAGGDARGASAAAQIGRAGGAAAAVAPVSEQVEHRQLRAAQLSVSRWLRSRHPPLPAQTGSWGETHRRGNRHEERLNTEREREREQGNYVVKERITGG